MMGMMLLPCVNPPCHPFPYPFAYTRAQPIREAEASGETISFVRDGDASGDDEADPAGP